MFNMSAGEEKDVMPVNWCRVKTFLELKRGILLVTELTELLRTLIN